MNEIKWKWQKLLENGLTREFRNTLNVKWWSLVVFPLLKITARKEEGRLGIGKKDEGCLLSVSLTPSLTLSYSVLVVYSLFVYLSFASFFFFHNSDGGGLLRMYRSAVFVNQKWKLNTPSPMLFPRWIWNRFQFIFTFVSSCSVSSGRVCLIRFGFA